MTSAKQLPLFDAVEIPITKGYTALVDPIDADLMQFKWFVHERDRLNYARRNFGKRPNRKIRYMHQVILERSVGRMLNPTELVDHINGNGLDNRRSNLRIATSLENSQNRKMRIDNSTGFKGVCYRQKENKYYAHIRINGKVKHLGSFFKAEDAHQAYCIAARKYFGEFARTE